MKKPTQVAETRYVISLSRIKDLPDHRRPRELALEAGVQNVPDDVLVAILLRAGIRGQSVIDLARQLLDRDLVSGGNAILLAARAHDCEHGVRTLIQSLCPARQCRAG